jgi:hypothetical protein
VLAKDLITSKSPGSTELAVAFATLLCPDFVEHRRMRHTFGRIHRGQS